MAYGFNGTRPGYVPQQQSQSLLGLGGNKQFLGDALNVLGTSLLGLGSGRDDWGLLAMQALQQRQQDRLANSRQAQQDNQQAQMFEFQKREYEAKQAQAQREQAAEAQKMQQFQQLLPTLPPQLQQTAQAMGPSFVDLYGKEQVQQAFPSMEPNSSIAKAAADLKAGLIDQPTYDAIVRKETYIAPQQPREPRAANWITLVGPGNKEVTVDANSPDAANLVRQGYVERRASLFPSAPTGYQPDPTNPTALVPVQGGPADPNKPTDTQRNEFKKQTLALDNFETAIANYEAAIKKYGAVEFSGEGKALLDNAYRDLMIQAKEAANLGALTGPDMDIMNQMLIPPNTVSGGWAGQGGIEAQLGQVKQTIAQKRRNLNNVYGSAITPQQPASNNDPLGIR